MDWISWSRTWVTTRTTTTSRKPLRCRPSTTCSSSRTVLIFERTWICIDPGAQSDHGDLPRAEDGAIEFWRPRRWFSEQIWALSKLVLWCVEEQDGRRRRQQEKISMLYWPVRTRNSLPASSSRSFRTQSHWSYTAGQCVNSEQFLRVHLSYWMCNQFTLHHKFRTDTWRTKIWAKDRQYSLEPWTPWIKITGDPRELWFDQTTSCIVQAKVEKAPGYDVLGRCTTSSTERIKVLSNKINRNHPLWYTPSLLYLESSCDKIWWNHFP